MKIMIEIRLYLFDCIQLFNHQEAKHIAYKTRNILLRDLGNASPFNSLMKDRNL